MAELRVPTDDGASLSVTISGEGPALVLCHGGPGLWDYFDDLAHELEDLVTVVRWDQRGCGRSTDGKEPHSVARYVEDLDTVRATLDLDRWIVGGHSWGAALALQYVFAHADRADALVYVSGTGIGQKWHDAFRDERRRRLGDDFDRWLGLAQRDRNGDEDREYRLLSWSIDFVDRPRSGELAGKLDRPFAINQEANRQICEEMSAWAEEDLVAKCGRVTVPALVLHGAHDPRPAWAIDSLVNALPNAEALVLVNAGHTPWLEAPESFSAPLRSFIRRRVGPDLNAQPMRG